MAKEPQRRLAYCLRPLWVGIGIGILAGAILEGYFWLDYRHDITFRGFRFKDINWVSYPIVLVEWGFVLGLLASVDRIARTWKKRLPADSN